MPTPEMKFYTNLVVPSITENGNDVVNTSELDTILSNKGYVTSTDLSSTLSSYLTTNQNISISGDATGSGTTSISLTLSNSGVTAGTYENSATQITPITIDAKGRITSTGTPVTITPAFSSITSKPTTLSGYGITDAQSLNSNLTSISGLSSSSTGLIKLTNGTASFDTNSYLTSNQSISISGDATGGGTTSISLTLSNSGVTPGTYTAVTVDAKGRVTSGSSGSSTYNVVTTSSNYNVLATDGIILANGAITLTLPAASTVTGKLLRIKRISNSGPVTVNVTSNGTIDGYTAVTIDQQYTSLTIVSNGSSWWLV